MINLKNFKPTKKPQPLEAEINRLFELLQTMTPYDEGYSKVSDELKKLYPLKEIDSKKRISSDAIVGALTNLLGIAVIVNHEHLNVITSKALGMVGKKIIS